MTELLRNPATFVRVAIAVIGLALLIYGLTLPVYHDLDLARQLKLNACIDGEVVAGWHERMRAVRTLRYPIMQTGASLILASATWAMLLRIFPSDSPWLPNTPGDGAAFLAIGVGVIATDWLALMVSLSIDFYHEMLPWCADSIGIPGIFMTIGFAVIGVVSFVIGGLATLAFGQLPVSMTHWDRNRPLRSWAVTLLLLIPIALTSVLALQSAHTSGFLGTPPMLVAIYLLASTRAALIAGKTEPN